MHRLFSRVAAIVLGMIVVSLPAADVSVVAASSVTASIDASASTTTSVLVTPGITIANATSTPIDTVTVVLGGYLSGDQLAVTSTIISDLVSSFQIGAAGNVDGTSAILTLTGTGTAADWQTVLRTLTFSTTSTGVSDRSISVVLANARYFSNNGHYYRVVTGGSAVTWTDAKAAASASTLFGVQGYLVTITSATENAFLASKVKVNSWFGASDEMSQVNAVAGTAFSAQGTGKPGSGSLTATNAEGHWYWVTGPEAGTLFCLGDQTSSSTTATYTSVGYRRCRGCQHRV